MTVSFNLPFFSETFTSSSNAVITHNLNESYLFLTLTIDGVVRNDLIEKCLPDPTDPRNKLNIVLTQEVDEATAKIQGSEFCSINVLPAEDAAFLQSSSLSNLQTGVDTNSSEQYLVISSSANLPNAKVLSGGLGLNLTPFGNNVFADVLLTGQGGIAILTGSDGGLILSASIPDIGNGDASDITYDPSSSQLTSSNVQSAIDEIDGRIDVLELEESKSIFGIWAEENARLGTNNFEWSFGNGDETPNGSGIVVPVDCTMFAVGLDLGSNGTATVAVYINGVPSGATVTVTNGRNALNTLGIPINVSAGDVIGFRTVSGPGSNLGNRIVAWFRTTNNVIGGGVDSVFGRSGSVSAESGDYNASQIPFNNSGTSLAGTNVQDALVELADLNFFVSGSSEPNSFGTGNFTQKTQISLTNIPAGTYLIMYSYEVANTPQVVVTRNAVDVISEGTITAGGVHDPHSGFIVEDLAAGSYTYEIFFANGDIRRARLLALRLG
jgi:hypothetical protein